LDRFNKKCVSASLSALAVFAVLAALTAGRAADAFNRDLANWIQSAESPAMTAFFKAISGIGEWYVYIPVALLLLAAPKSRFAAGIPAAAALAVSAALNQILKAAFAVPRPDAHRLICVAEFSFPSGHAMNGASFVGICAVLFWRSSCKKKHKAPVLGAAAVFLLFLGISRIYLGVHTPADVLAGYAAGLCVCFAAAAMAAHPLS
jgi:undecaprenyl-diphosphatase